MFFVVALTEVTVSFRLVTVFAANDSVNGEPSFGNVPTGNDDPSLNVIVPPVI